MEQIPVTVAVPQFEDVVMDLARYGSALGEKLVPEGVHSPGQQAGFA
jgi:hypothetical protein